jgi:hypothetical protein
MVKKLSTNEFMNKILKRRIELIKKTLIGKHKEYALNDDFLLNFSTGARLDDSTPEQILWGYMLKQYVSVRKIVKNPNTVYPQELIDEKIGDVICYLVLLEAILYAKKQEKA